ncbi:MAG: 2-oxo acid dehydrogenase subunit E2 [Myxococcales bacterium]|nr:2-oxo acid dehydrogenase subunit E2 [Myxococcales bacterium]
MTIAVELPALGESVVEGTVSKWLVAEGDRVALDQPLLEVTTDKVDAEIPSPEPGIVEKILVAEGETVPVGAQLVLIASEVDPRPVDDLGESGSAAASNAAAASGARRVTPLARRIAEQERVDLDGVSGSGAGGRILKADVLRGASVPAPPPAPAAETESLPANPVAASPAPAPARPAPRPAFLDYQLMPGDKLIPMTPLRRLVAEHMVMSKRVSPHVGTVAEIDMGAVSEVRDAHKRAFKSANGFGLSFLPFIVHASVRALREFPQLNASVLEDAIVEKKDIHIGIAVEIEKGLVVPVVRHADRLSLAGLAQAVEDLAHRARNKKLSADELKGGTFTISNPGRHGNLYGFAIINQPQVGILRMGEIVKRPVVRSVGGDDAIVLRPMMHLALSYDHRAVDGSPANGFLFRIRQLLEEGEFDL